MVFITGLLMFQELIKFCEKVQLPADALRIIAPTFHALTGFPDFLNRSGFEVPFTGGFVEGLRDEPVLYRESFRGNKPGDPFLFRSQRAW